jgi:hypothetical protein
MVAVNAQHQRIKPEPGRSSPATSRYRVRVNFKSSRSPFQEPIVCGA